MSPGVAGDVAAPWDDGLVVDWDVDAMARVLLFGWAVPPHGLALPGLALPFVRLTG
jgi:hypothetical protein